MRCLLGSNANLMNAIHLIVAREHCVVKRASAIALLLLISHRNNRSFSLHENWSFLSSQVQCATNYIAYTLGQSQQQQLLGEWLTGTAETANFSKVFLFTRRWEARKGERVIVAGSTIVVCSQRHENSVWKFGGHQILKRVASKHP